ncbi:MAG: GNAT family N-acetyltransferase [Austwickia sp.]|nr:GNAT family N-acetyltransferase [Austwickia sp.]
MSHEPAAPEPASPEPASGSLKPQLSGHVTLRDGTVAWVRALRPHDRSTLAHEYESLSPPSRRLRFMASVPHLTNAMLDHLVDDVDGVEHVALVLGVTTPQGPEPVGIGRILRYKDLPEAADLAVTVKDDWQGRGVASALMPLLVEHRPPGVTYLLTEVSAHNPASLAMLRRVGPTRTHPSEPGVIDVEVDLSDGGVRHERPGPQERLHPALAVPHARCQPLPRRDRDRD